MTQKTYVLPLRFSFVGASVVLLSAVHLCAQSAPAKPLSSTPVVITPAPAAGSKEVPAKAADPVVPAPDRALSYYHLALANSYEDDAATLGRPEFVTKAIEEFKLALNADPTSPQLNNGLA